MMGLNFLHGRKSMICCVVGVFILLTISSVVSVGSSVYFYFYGSTTCYYCRVLDEFMSKTYSGRYQFCKINIDESCYNGLTKVVDFLMSKGVSLEYLRYIPQTYVVRDGEYLIAIVVGGITDQEFWKNITSRKPQESVLFIIPPEEFEIPMSFQDQLRLISIILNHSTIANGVTPSNTTLNLHHIMLVGLLISAIAATFIILYTQRIKGTHI